MHADRTNRTVLTLFGVLVLAAGVAALLASVGAFTRTFSHHALLDNAVGRYFSRQGTWLWAVIAIACGLIILLVLRWLYALLATTDRASDVTVPGDRRQGRTTLRPGAVADAISSEIGSYRGVRSARARVIGDPAAPQLVVTATVDADADLPTLTRRIRDNAVAHARTALDRPDLRVQLDIGVAREASERVA